jgi:hypothetical protein
VGVDVDRDQVVVLHVFSAPSLSKIAQAKNCLRHTQD